MTDLAASPHPCDSFLKSTGTPWGSTRWAEAQRCEVAHTIAYDPQRARRFGLPVIQASAGRESSWRSDDGRRVGSLVHAVLAWAADHEQRGEGCDPWAPLNRATELPNEWDPAHVSEARRLLSFYARTWGWTWAAAGYDIVGVEVAFADEIGGLPDTGRADLILRDRSDGRLVVCDHKSAGRTPSRRDSSEDPEAAIGRLIAVRPQFVALSHHVRLHYELDYYPDVLGNFLIRTKAPAFYRVRKKMLARTIAAWHAARVRMAGEINAERAPVANLHECVGPWGDCWAYDLCHGTKEGESE